MESQQGDPPPLALPRLSDALGSRSPLVVAGVLGTGLLLVVAVVLGARSVSGPAAAGGAVDVVPASGPLPDCRYLDPPGRDVRILFVGDSMTQGRSGSATYRYWTWKGLTSQRDDVRFVGPVTELSGRAGTDAYEHLDGGFADQLHHAARAGATFASSRAEFPPVQMVRDHEPDVVVLQLGFNDSNTRRTTPEQLAGMFESYMNATWEVAPRTRFVLGQIPPAEGAPGKERITAARNERTDAANAIVADRWADMPCRVQVNDLRTGQAPAWQPDLDTYDGSHPGPVGETLMADRMLGSLARVGVLREPVHVYDPEETWDPDPQVRLRVLGRGKVRIDWADEGDRLSAEAVRLRIVSDDGTRDTRWFTRRSPVIDLDPGLRTVRAIVSRGLPGRMVSQPGAPQEILVR